MLGHAFEGQVAIVVFHVSREGNAQVGGLEGVEAGGKLIFLGQCEAHGHIVHGALLRNEFGKAAGVGFLSGEEGQRVGDLIGVGKGEVLGVQSQ